MKVIILACLVGLAMCAPQQRYEYEAPQPQQRYEEPPQPRYESPSSSSEEKYDPEPYHFSLAVADDEFTNYQSRVESQDENGLVQGEYSWVGPDSIRYITRYTADAVNGFQVQTTEEQTDIKIRIPEPVSLEDQAGYEYRPAYE